MPLTGSSAQSTSGRRLRPRGGAGRRGRRRWRWLDAVGLLAAFVTGNAILARAVNTTWHPYILLACLAPLWVPVSAAVTVLLTGLHRRVVGAVLVVLTVVLALPYAPLAWHAAFTRPAAGGIRITVISLNLRLGSADVDSVMRLVEHQHADVLALQELTPGELGRLDAAGLSESLSYRYTVAAPRAAGIGIFSRWPLTQQHYHPGFSNHVLSAVLTVPAAGRVTVYSSHLSAPWPQGAGPWQREAARLGRLLDSTSGCVLDAGDFNATTDHAALRSLLALGRVRDAATEVGALALRSYPADTSYPPLIAIDHVLLRGLRATRAQSLHVRGTDHRALLSTMRVGAC